MDIGTHLATGLAVSTFVEEPTAKIACIVGSVIPDMVFLPYYVYRISQKDWHFWKHMKKEGTVPHHPQWERNLYHFVHSFVFLIILYLCASLLQSYMLWGFFLGYATHILWDVPTHTGEFANRPLYPFSRYSIQGFQDWWKHPVMRKLAFCSCISLVSVYFFLQF